MKVETIDGTLEGRVLTSMIVSKTVLAQIAPKWRKDLFYSRWSQSIGKLCVDFYKKHNDAPGLAIGPLYASWGEHQRDQEVVRVGQQFLESLNRDYVQSQEEVNPAYMLDQAGLHFREVMAGRFKNEFESALAVRDIDKAEQLIAAYQRVEVGAAAGVDLFIDKEEVQSVFIDEEVDDLVVHHDALGSFFRGALGRDALVAFMGPDKSGKSMWLLDGAWRAMLGRKRVAYFEAGDLSKKQIEKRFLVRAAGHPSRSTNKDGGWPCKVKVPDGITATTSPDGVRTVKVSNKPKTFEKALDSATAWRACETIMNGRVNSKRSFFKLSCHPNSSLSVTEIKSIIEGWANQDWVPDVVIIDYADILAPPPGHMEVRDQINENWKKLRRLSQEFHCLVLTATQSDAKGYEQGTLSRKNFSEDKRKLAHVSAMCGINITDEEKEKGLCRLNWIVKREGAYSSRKCVTAAQCLALCDPAVKSVF